MNKRDKEDLKAVLALLEDIADFDQTPEEAQAELASDGVNISAFLARVQHAVEQQKKEERLAWTRDAQKNIEAFKNSQDIGERFASMSRVQLEIEARAFASEVHFKNLGELSDEDLRTILADRARLEALSKK